MSDKTKRLGETAAQQMNAASQLLRVGALGPRRAVDELIERLAKPDGAKWLPRTLDVGPLRDLGAGADAIALGEGRLTIDQLTALKVESKKMFSNATSEGDRLAGLAGYFLAIASGLRHHRTLIGAQGRGDLHNILLDLAEFAPKPYSDVLCGATLVATHEQRRH